MSNITIQNNKTRGIVLWDPVFKPELVTFAGANTFAAGTILARDSVSLKLVLFVKGGATNENGIPKAVLTQELIATGAGDLPARPLVGGQVRSGDLIIDSDGDASNIDAAVLDQLRDYGIVGLPTQQLAELDNQ
jgi:hypothetical protein